MKPLKKIFATLGLIGLVLVNGATAGICGHSNGEHYNIGANGSKKVTLNFTVNNYDAVSYTKSGNYYTEGSSGNVTTTTDSMSFNFKVKSSTGNYSNQKITIPSSSTVRGSFAYGISIGNNNKLSEHKCTLPNGCSGGIHAEPVLFISDSYKKHWLDYSLNASKKRGSYLQNYTYLNSHSQSGTSDSDISGDEAKQVKWGTSALHLDMSIKAHDVFGMVDPDGPHSWTWKHLPAWGDGAVSLNYTTKTIPNSSYITFIVPKACDIGNSNVVAKDLAEGRFVIRRSLNKILTYSKSIGEGGNKGNLGSTSAATTHLQNSTYLTTYGSGNDSSTVHGTKVSSAGKDSSAGKGVAVLGYQGQAIKAPTYAVNASTKSSATHELGNKRYSIEYYSYWNEANTSNVDNGNSYYKKTLEKSKGSAQIFSVIAEKWYCYDLVSGACTSMNEGSLVGINALNLRNTNANDTYDGKKLYFNQQGDIMYYNKYGGSFSYSNDFFVDPVYGMLKTNVMKAYVEKQNNGKYKTLWEGLTQGYNAIDNTKFAVAMPQIQNTGESIKITDNIHGYNQNPSGTSNLTSNNEYNIAYNNVDKSWKITLKNPKDVYKKADIDSYIQGNKVSTSSKNIYKADTPKFSKFERTFTADTYNIHFITSYGALYNTVTGQVDIGNLNDCFDNERLTVDKIEVPGATLVGTNEYVVSYKFGQQITREGVPKASIKAGTVKQYEAVRKENVDDNTGCHWYVGVKNPDGTFSCTFEEDMNLFNYLTGYKQTTHGSADIALGEINGVDVPNGADIYVFACWSPMKIRFYLNSDDGTVFVADNNKYYSDRDAHNKVGNLHFDLNRDGKTNELINKVKLYGMTTANSGNNNGEVKFDDKIGLCYVERYVDTQFDEVGKYSGYAEPQYDANGVMTSPGGAYKNGETVFPMGDTCYGYSFLRKDFPKKDGNGEAPWLYWARYIGNDAKNSNNYVGWNELNEDYTALKTSDKKGYAIAYNATNNGNPIHANSNLVYEKDPEVQKDKKLYTFNGVNDGKDYGNANDDNMDQVYLYGTWYPDNYSIVYDGNKNWNQKEVSTIAGGSADGKKYIMENIPYNLTIRLFDGFKREVGAANNTYDVWQHELHDNDLETTDDLDEWKLMGYYSTSHGSNDQRITAGNEKSVGNFRFDVSVADVNKNTQYNYTPNNEVRGLVGGGDTIELKAIWRRAVAVRYDLHGGFAVAGKFYDRDKLSTSKANALYTSGYMWNDEYSISLPVPYGELDKNTGTSDSIQKKGYRFIGWAFDELDDRMNASVNTNKSSNAGPGPMTVTDTRVFVTDVDNVTDNVNTKDVDESTNTIEKYNETFKPDSMIYIDKESGSGYPNTKSVLQRWQDKSSTVTDADMYEAGDRKNGCRHNLVIDSSVFGELTNTDLTVNGVAGLPSKNYDFYAKKNLSGVLNNENGFDKLETVQVINSNVAHAMWEGVFKARITYSVQGDERKTLQYSAINVSNYDIESIKREYAGEQTILCAGFSQNGVPTAGNNKDTINNLQGGNLFETSVSDISSVDSFTDMVSIRQTSYNIESLGAGDTLMFKSGVALLDKQYELDRTTQPMYTFNAKPDSKTLVELVNSLYGSKNDGLQNVNGLAIGGYDSIADVSGEDGSTILLTGLNGTPIESINKKYGFYRNNLFTFSNKLASSNYANISVRYQEYIPLYLHYTSKPNASDRNFIEECPNGEAGAYVIVTELRKMSFYHSLHTVNSNEYKPELLRIPLQLNIYSSEINSGTPDDEIPDIPTPGTPVNPNPGDPSHPGAEGGGVKSTLDLPQQ